MNYAQIRKYDIANGPGIRTTLFVSGCTHECEDCFNRDYWNFGYGKVFGKEEEELIINHVKETKHFTLLGGEPLQQDTSLISLLKEIKKTGADIWIWTGYTFEDIVETGTDLQKEIVSLADCLVDGLFEKNKKDLTLLFRGSTNQRIIDVAASLENKKTILMKDYK